MMSKRVRVLIAAGILAALLVASFVAGTQAGVPGWVDRRSCDFIQVDDVTWIECADGVRGSFHPFVEPGTPVPFE